MTIAFPPPSRLLSSFIICSAVLVLRVRRGDYGWNDIVCSNKIDGIRGCLCRITATPTIVENFGTSRFSYFPAATSFSTAQSTCQQHGGNLARISSEAEFEFIKNLQGQFGNKSYWLGVDARSSNLVAGTERFSFVDGSTTGLYFIAGIAGKLPWAESQPTDGFADDCVK